jgi:hypothetical protein
MVLGFYTPIFYGSEKFPLFPIEVGGSVFCSLQTTQTNPRPLRVICHTDIRMKSFLRVYTENTDIGKPIRESREIFPASTLDWPTLILAKQLLYSH